MKKEREANFELLRIVAMLMIIGLHFLSKGGILPDLTQKMGITGFLAWLFESFFLVSVDVYVLISGYFLIHSSFHIGRITKLYGTVWFYSVGMALFCIMTGIMQVAKLDGYHILTYIFPIIEDHYWFASSYLFMYLFAPFMNAGLQKLAKKEYQKLLGLLLLFFSLAKSFLPVTLPYDKQGYDVIWFLCLYCIGGYLKLYGIPALQKKTKAASLYVAMSFMTFSVMVFVYVIYQKTGHLEKFIQNTYSYNHIFCLIGAVALFSLFQTIKIENEKNRQRITQIAGTTFGVYLIHEHVDLRYVWPTFFHTKAVADSPYFLLLMPVAILTVFVIASLIEYVRECVFSFVKEKFFTERRR